MFQQIRTNFIAPNLSIAMDAQCSCSKELGIGLSFVIMFLFSGPMVFSSMNGELGKVIELRYEIFLFNAKFLQDLSLFSEWLACGGFGR